ncbi:MAG: hypothetical protein EOP54_01150 [Sphingobacteriales bacterium]|nr:MAG: hypothetical protein EOP54_01150 [Sphingobacteriales bacterium]
MKNILVILAFASGIHLAIMANANEVNFAALTPASNHFNDQDTTKNQRQANPKNKRKNTRDSMGMPPDIKTDTATVPPTPFDTLSNPSRQRRT